MLNMPLTSLSSPFHPGEIHVQRQAGTRGTAKELGTFLAHALNLDSGVAIWLSTLRVAWLASVTPRNTTRFENDNSPGDKRPRIWVSAVFGPPRFISVRNSKSISIAVPSDSPQQNDILYSNISTSKNAPIAFLALDLQARRRYRANGVVPSFPTSSSSLDIRVKEAFPNCPKYIQKRVITNSTSLLNGVQTSTSLSAVQTTELSSDDVRLIKNADTFFLGTYHPSAGVDVSHRGGLPGFVRILNQKSLMWPDYRGNGMFQSFGNLHMNDRAGVTFFEFETGSLLQLTGRARVDWDSHPGQSLESAAERSVRFDIDAVRRSSSPVTNYRWLLLENSPYNPEIPRHHDSHSKDPHALPMAVTLTSIKEESNDVKTFRFIAKTFVKFLPGQYATFEFKKLDGIPNSDLPAVRTWTLSEAANSTKGDLNLEVSVKRKRGGLISTWLHERATPGMQIILRGIGGEMTPFGTPDGPPSKLLMISAGIGITPNMAIIRGLGVKTDNLDFTPDVMMFHQERRFGSMPFRGEVLRRSKTRDGKLRITVFLSNGILGEDIETEYYHSGLLKTGQIEIEHIQASIDDLRERTVYLCGPVGFMDNITRSLVGSGVKPENIITEKFDF